MWPTLRSSGTAQKPAWQNPFGGLRCALTISHAACRVENRVTLLNPPYAGCCYREEIENE